MSRSAPLRTFLLLFLSALLAVPALARAATWRLAGPDGGNFALAVDPTDPDVVYASGKFLFKTTDGGESWRVLPFPSDWVGVLAIDPANPQTLYAASSYRGVYRSLDGGETWKVVWASTEDWVEGGIRIDPAGGTIHVQLGRGMLRSTDGGATWQWSHPLSSRLTSFALDPVVPGVLYAGADIEGIARSADGGRTWRRFGRPSASLLLLSSLAVERGERRNQRRLYATTWQGVVRSDDGGFTWTTVWHEPDRVAQRVVLAGGTLYLATTSSSLSEIRASLLRSSDGGKTWQRTGAGLFAYSFNALVAAPSDPHTLYVSPLAQGVFRSRDGAESWTRASRGLRPTLALPIVADPSRPGHLLLGTQGAGVLATRDGGATWSVDPRPSHLFYVWGLSLDPARPDRVFAASFDRLVRSEDRGTTWTSTGPAGFEGIFGLDPDHEGTLYARSRDGVQRSRDGGATWTLLAEPLACMSVGQLLVVPGSGALIARTFPRPDPQPSCGFTEGYYRSRDGGASWTPISDRFHGQGFLKTDPSTPGVLYRLDSGLAKSTDDGDTWTAVARVPGKGSAMAVALLVTPGAYYLGGYDGSQGRVWVSHDAGASWSALGPPLPLDLVEGLAVDQGVLWAVALTGLYRLDP
jgi:photosystem II stability/assembly factor-like uncharacterized protein